ncbi:MAG: flippase-like domain-containing protein [Clostridia bacterium]|nr:flippase-like domain-containing protein [Clostridia bacterium]
MAIRESIQRMRTDIRAAYKSEDTEEFFDRIFTKPLGYLWARFFMKIGWSPNMVTLLSMGIGFTGGLLFYPENFSINLIGVLLVIFANILDSTDGQLARLTGNKSTLGRILDGLSTSVWYVAIYCALCLRLMDHAIPFSGGKPWGGWIWVVVFICAIFGHERQCMIADYLRNIHLFFLKGKSASELDSSREIAKSRASLPWTGARFQKIYLFFYGMYTFMQELATPNFQRLIKGYEQAEPEQKKEAREQYRKESLKYIQLTNILTFNARAYTLFGCVLIGAPLLYFPIELFVFGFLCRFMRSRYEIIAENVLVHCRLPGSETPIEKKKRMPVVFFIIGVVGVIFMLAKTDLGRIDWQAILHSMPIWLPSLIGLWAAIYAVHTFAYLQIMGEDKKRISFVHMFKVVISGFALNHVTPVGMIGGEPYRIMELKPKIGTEKATATTLTFTVMHTFSHIMYWLTSAVLFLIFFGFSKGILAPLVAILVAMLGVYICFAFFRSGSKGLAVPFLSLLSRIPLIGRVFSNLIDKNRESLETVDREMMAFHARKRDFWATVCMEYAARLMEAVEFYIIFLILGVKITYPECVIALGCASLIGNLMFFVPMQVGSREFGLALSLGWTGVSASFGVTASLLSRIREIFYVALGVGAMLIKSGTRPETEAGNSDEKREETEAAEAAETSFAEENLKTDDHAENTSEEAAP